MRKRTTAIRKTSDSKAAPRIRFSATLLSPRQPTARPGKGVSRGGGWAFLMLPKESSAKLPSRGMVSVEGTLNGLPFRATLEPDGQGGHWLKVDRTLRAAIRASAKESGATGADAGAVVTLDIAPVAPDREPEPKVPADLRKALAVAPGAGGAKAREAWSDVTPLARRDWIQWIVSAKQAETRARRIRNACDMLAKGKRRPCCFDRSGMYAKSLSCPAPDAAPGLRP